jgi:serine/threonine protein kinase/WD40 repeat protein
MPAPRDCPGAECWQALLADALPPDQQERCERHLESCAACQGHLDRAEECQDAVPTLVRQVGDPAAAPADPTLARVLQRLRDVKSPLRAAPLDPADLYFLRPSDRPGVLGLLGDYEVREVIGQGGMGVVLKAFDPPLHRLVAIKVLTPAIAGSATARRRFTREAQAAAAVSHDHIVTVHGVYETDGLPYLVMQYITGESLQARLDRAGPLEVAEVVRIGHQTASALAAAHAQGLIHRDIKPANILLEDGLARVKITDFGLARTADDVGLTQTGVVAGTPAYMAPEQARGERVDHRADLFSLGSVLYACCTGLPPFHGSTPLAVLRRVSDQEPTPIRSLNPDVPAWLEALVARLLAKDPAQRFQSAAEVAALLEGYLAHLREPVTVPPPTLPSPPAGGRRGVATPLRAAGPPVIDVRGLALMLLIALAVALIAVGGRSVLGPPAPDTGRTAPGRVRTADDLRAVNTPAPPLRRLRGHTGPVHNILFTPDGRLVSAGGWPQGDHTLRVWNPATGKELRRFNAPGQVQALGLSADGRFALAGLDLGDMLYLDLETGDQVRQLRGHGWVVSWVGFAPDGRHAFSTAIDGTARMWDLSDGREVRQFPAWKKWVRAGAVSPDGRRLLTGGEDGVLQLWDVATGQEVKRITTDRGWINGVAFTPDGGRALVAAREAAVYDLETGKPVRVFAGDRDEVHQVALSPDGRRLLTAGWDGGVRLWDVETGELLRLLGRHDEFVFSVAFARDGRLAASAGGGRRNGEHFLPGDDHDIRLWEVPAAGEEHPGEK